MTFKELLIELPKPDSYRVTNNDTYIATYPAKKYTTLVVRLDPMDIENRLRVINNDELENMYFIGGSRVVLYVDYKKEECTLTVYDKEEMQ